MNKTWLQANYKFKVFKGFCGLSINKTISKNYRKTNKKKPQPFFPIGVLPDGDRLQKLNTKQQRINRAISEGHSL